MKSLDGMIQAIEEWTKSLVKRSSDGIKEEMDSNTILRKTGDASKVTNVFSQSGKRMLPTSGEELDITLGKILRYLNDLQPVVFSNLYSDLNEKPVEDLFQAEIEAITAAENVDLYYFDDGSSYWGELEFGFSTTPLLVYGDGGVASATNKGTTDFMRCYLVFPRRENMSTGAGEGWGLVQLGSSGSTARWSLATLLTTASSYKKNLILKVPKGSWARVCIMSLPNYSR